MVEKQSKKVKKESTVKTTKKAAPSAASKGVRKVNKSSAKVDVNPHSNHLLRAVIILLVVAFILAGGFAIWYFAYYNNPDKVAYDAIQHILKSDSLALEGTGTIVLSGDVAEESPVSKVVLSMNSSGKSLPAASATQVSVYLNQDVIPYDQPLVVSAQTIFAQDGTLYFQISGIADSIDSLLDEMGEELDESILAIFDTIEGEWWQVAPIELIREYTATGEREIAVYQDMYDCALNVMRRDNSKDIIDTLKEHRFISIEPAEYLEANDDNGHMEVAGGYQAYTINFDKSELVGFINQIPHTEAAAEFVTCYNNAVEKADGDKINVDDLEELDTDDIDTEFLEDVHISAEISRASHRVRSIRTYYNEDGVSINSAIMLKYDAAKVEAPESYRPVAELVDELSDIVTELLSVGY